MTLENCKKYMEEAVSEEDKIFWAERIERKYPVPKKEKVEKKKAA